MCPMNEPFLSRFLFRETIRNPASAEGKIIRQIGGIGNYAHVHLSVEPLPRGQGLELLWSAGNAIPPYFIESVEHGIMETIGHGLWAGFELTDIRVNVANGSYHDADSNASVFREAAVDALTRAIRQADPVILEAVATVVISIHSDEWQGMTIGAINARRGMVKKIDLHPLSISATVPVSEIPRLFSSVADYTQGRAGYSASAIRYEDLSSTEIPPEDEWSSYT
jgi:elongation factor G